MIELLGNPPAPQVSPVTFENGTVYAQALTPKQSGWIRQLLVRTGAPQPSLTYLSAGILPVKPGTFPLSPGSGSFAVGEVAGRIYEDEWAVVLLRKPVRVAAGVPVFLAVRPFNSSMNMYTEGSTGRVAVLKYNGLLGASSPSFELTTLGGFGIAAFGDRLDEPAGLFLRDVQLEAPSCVFRARLSDPAGTLLAADDVKGIQLQTLGEVVPIFGEPGLCRRDPDSSVLCKQEPGGESPDISTKGLPENYFGIQASEAFTIEGVTAREMNGSTFRMWYGGGSMEVLIEGASVTFAMETSFAYSLKATSALKGYPQLIQCIYDASIKLMSIWIDGAKVASQPAEGVPRTFYAGGSVYLLDGRPSSGRVEAVGQDIALYNSALSAQRIAQHYAAFRQHLSDPGHVRL